VAPPRRVAWVPLLLAACTPPLTPGWLIAGPRELALDVRVTATGPYGAPLVPSPRTARDALPLDALALQPVVVDEDGLLDPDELEATWVLCSGLGNCLLRAPVAERPRCTGEAVQPPEPCTFGEGGQATLTLADFSADLPDETTLFSLIEGLTVGWLASAPQGPGLAACIARLDARTRLDGCLLMERSVNLGPLGDLARALESLGIDPGIDPDAETLLSRPRNHNPAVERLRVDQGRRSVEVDAGARVPVDRSEAVVLTVLTTDDDLEPYTITSGEQELMLQDDLGAQWWFDAEVDWDDDGLQRLSTRVSAGDTTGVVRAYVVVRDDRGGEGWGFVDLEWAG